MTRQQVNLYLPEFRPSHDWLDAAHLARALVVVLVLLLIHGGVTWWRIDRAEALRMESQRQADTLMREAEALEREVAANDISAQLQEQVDDAENALARSRDTLGFLRELRLGNVDGFSEQLKDLSRAGFDGLWLTEIALSEGGERLRLQGVATESVMLPAYVSRLGQGSSAVGDMQFHRLSTRRDSTGPGAAAPAYEFMLETR